MIEDIKYLCNEVIIIKSGQILKVAHSNEIASLASGRVYKIPERELSNLKSPFYIENYLIRDNEKNEKIVKVLLLAIISYVLIMLYLKSFLLLYWEYYQKIIELIGISLKSFL